MEHRLITGGESFLPFARSCVAKLCKLGLPYADQSYEVDGVSIKVRIQPGHEYIRIEGGPKTLSGVIKEGDLIDNEVCAFKPTEDCLKKVLNKPLPAVFACSKKLADSGAKERYSSLVATQFSGEMAKAVQLMMGMKLDIPYSSTWETSHGIVRDSDNKTWVVEISKANGVIAQKLKTVKGAGGIEVGAEANRLFGGLPLAAKFPTELAEAIADGKVLRLLEPSALDDYYDQKPYVPWMGFSFSPTGHEAHNTCYSTVEMPMRTGLDYAHKDEVWGHHYMISLVITAATEDEPASGAAVLTEVSNNRIVAGSGFGVASMNFNPFDGYTTVMPYQGVLINDPEMASATVFRATVFVFHTEAGLQKVESVMGPLGEPSRYTHSIRHSTLGNVVPKKRITLKGPPLGSVRTGFLYDDTKYFKVFETCRDAVSVKVTYSGTIALAVYLYHAIPIGADLGNYSDYSSTYYEDGTGSCRAVLDWGYYVDSTPDLDGYWVWQYHFVTSEFLAVAFWVEPSRPPQDFRVDFSAVLPLNPDNGFSMETLWADGKVTEVGDSAGVAFKRFMDAWLSSGINLGFEHDEEEPADEDVRYVCLSRSAVGGDADIPCVYVTGSHAYTNGSSILDDAKDANHLISFIGYV